MRSLPDFSNIAKGGLAGDCGSKPALARGNGPGLLPKDTWPSDRRSENLRAGRRDFAAAAVYGCSAFATRLMNSTKVMLVSFSSYFEAQ